MYTLLNLIITKMTTVYNKIKRVDRFWSTNYDLTCTVTNKNSYTVTVTDPVIYAQSIRFSFTLKPPSNVSAATNVQKQIASLTFTSPTGTTTIQDCIPSGAVPKRNETIASGTSSATRPMVNCTLTGWTRDNANSMTVSLYIGTVIGAQLTSSNGAQGRFETVVPRLMP